MRQFKYVAIFRLSDFFKFRGDFLNAVQSKKRGLSLDEKREKMLQIFYDSQDFFLVSVNFNEFIIICTILILRILF